MRSTSWTVFDATRGVAVILVPETFRNQYARVLQAPMLVLRASVDLTLTGRAFRARSRIAHGFEHVVELLDGLDLRTLNERRARGVWRVGAMFETQRAVRAGLLVGTEMRRQHHEADNFGE